MQTAKRAAYVLAHGSSLRAQDSGLQDSGLQDSQYGDKTMNTRPGDGGDMMDILLSKKKDVGCCCSG